MAFFSVCPIDEVRWLLVLEAISRVLCVISDQ